MTGIDLASTLAVALSPAAWMYQLWGAEGASQVFWTQQIMAGALAVLVALLLDRLWGEPPRLAGTGHRHCGWSKNHGQECPKHRYRHAPMHCL